MPVTISMVQTKKEYLVSIYIVGLQCKKWMVVEPEDNFRIFVSVGKEVVGGQLLPKIMLFSAWETEKIHPPVRRPDGVDGPCWLSQGNQLMEM